VKEKRGGGGLFKGAAYPSERKRKEEKKKKIILPSYAKKGERKGRGEAATTTITQPTPIKSEKRGARPFIGS